jgi:hypothetical protein
MPPRTAGFGNQERVELNGMIGLHRPQNHSASGNAASGSITITLHSMVAFHCNQHRQGSMVANIDFPICT